MRHHTTHATSALLGAVAATVFPAIVPHRDVDRDVLGQLLQHTSVVHLDDGRGGLAKTIRFTGVNVQVVNGLDATNGYPGSPTSTDPALTATNGVGNLIVGYNEPPGTGGRRTGSHNLVVGRGHSFGSYGGLVVASDNTIGAPYACVTGGTNNRASARHSSISGGRFNKASGDHSSVTGGERNRAAGHESSVAGGWFNHASGRYAFLAGGKGNLANGRLSSIHGGNKCTTEGEAAVVSGGKFNTASGMFATVHGGELNVADGLWSSISGGRNRVVSQLNPSGNTDHDWVGGALWQDR